MNDDPEYWFYYLFLGALIGSVVLIATLDFIFR